MTVPHPDAVGSYGLECERLFEETFGMRLRWWQRLACRRQLEHDRAGALVWHDIVESTPRRSGKSWRVRAAARWRLVQAGRFGEPQLIMLTGKDLPICKEIHRKLWPWAEATGNTILRTNGQEAVQMVDESRWMVRGQSSVYGYDVSYGQVDEAWAVDEAIIDDGLEPALLERPGAQLHLTSTAHRKAKRLMPRRILAALEQMYEPRRSLLMLWGAAADLPVEDPATWRAASPHWSQERAADLTERWTRTVSGRAEVDEDEEDPFEAWRAQYLNIWPLQRRTRSSWLDLHAWDSARDETPMPERVPFVAVEDRWPGQAAIAAAWTSDGRVHVTARHVDSVEEAWTAAGRGDRVLCGVTLAAGEHARRLRAQARGAKETSVALPALRRAVHAGQLRWSGDLLDEQVHHAMIREQTAGTLTVAPRPPTDALRAAAWAFHALHADPPSIPQVF